MIRRPLNARFTDAVRQGRKITTIRDKAWPRRVPIMLYNWSAAAYRSPQIEVAPISVITTRPILIHRLLSGTLVYEYSADGFEPLVVLWRCEGFDSQDDMDRWFAGKLTPGKSVSKHLMQFRLL